MLIAEKRPRNLTWLHAGPLLFGDWGTSRLYVLGLAFFYTAHASALYLGVMSLIMIAVAWGYTIVCRCFPDGGGVYASARRISVPLSVIGATLLLCDYIVTATLSAVEAFHYFGVPKGWVEGMTVASLVLLGVINWFGARRAANFAMFIATFSLLMSFLIGLACMPFFFEGVKHLQWTAPGQGGLGDRWHSLVAIMLALSGVEAVSNMTSLMKEPVEKTAKKTIWPVLIEVVTFNMIFGIAISGLPTLVKVATPHYQTEVKAKVAESGGTLSYGDAMAALPPEIVEYQTVAVKVLATESGQHWLGEQPGFIFGKIAAVIFGLLLLSAANTAIMAMVSVLYAMGQDKEVPPKFTKLNYSGVPWFGLLVATAAPILLLVIVGSSVPLLAQLYAVGVVGAIAINLLCCAYNRELAIGRFERMGLWAVGLFMLAVEVTIVVDKPNAGLFAGIMVGSVLIARWFVHARTAQATLAEPAGGWLDELRAIKTLPATPGPRIMLAARGRDQAQFAVDLARQRKGVLFVIFVRTLRLVDVVPNNVPRIETDPDAQESLGTVVRMAKQAGVPVFPIYITSADVAAEILDYTVTFGCDTLIMGKSKRAVVSRALAGDVVSEVASHLPEGVTLLTRAPGAYQPVEQVVVVEDPSPAETEPSPSRQQG
jgi:amino acid transporter/nucleotide-binding universal stress UspA family protein